MNQTQALISGSSQSGIHGHSPEACRHTKQRPAANFTLRHPTPSPPPCHPSHFPQVRLQPLTGNFLRNHYDLI